MLTLRIPYQYKQEFLPTKRHRRLRFRNIYDELDVQIKELADDDFPIAFIVTDYDFLYERDGQEPEFKLHDMEIRYHDGELWKAVRKSDIVHRGGGWMSVADIEDNLRFVARSNFQYGDDQSDQFGNDSVINEDDKIVMETAIRIAADSYIVFDSKVWRKCGEPMYNIHTFGLGHNHGGTGFFIEYSYNSNISAKNYFNALEREKAIAYGRMVAERRGDTDSIDRIGDGKKIEVLMPELVKRNPANDHGDGDAFMNGIEEMIQTSDSVMEAGILTVLHCMKGA